MFKIVCLSDIFKRLSAYQSCYVNPLVPRVLYPLTIGISAVVYFVASTRQLPVQVGIHSSTDQWLSAVKQLVCSTDQSLSDVKETAFLNGPMVKQYL